MPNNSLSYEDNLEQMIRVNHAGELGAKRIYQGQLAVLKNSSAAPNIKHMMEQELEHLEYFENKLGENKIRPSILTPLWNVSGFALGAATALMGEKTAYACTVAVEEVIDEHYREQQDYLSGEKKADSELKSKIDKFRQEELEHRDLSLENDAEQAPFYELISKIVKTGSKAAIWAAKRF